MPSLLPLPSAPMLMASACLASVLLTACAGSGKGLDANGNPIGTGGSSSAPLSADFQSIQDNVFTPICTKCHIGANAPEGLQLDQAHSFALLVGVPSAEVPAVLRVKAGDPTDSYLIQKLQGSSGIVGVQMPFGGPYLPQATIDVIRQWITNGAPAPVAAAIAHESVRAAALEVIATTPVGGGSASAPVETIAIGLTQPLELGSIGAAVHLQNVTAQPVEVPVMVAEASANPATVLLTPLAPLAAGVYRVTLHGGDAMALTGANGASLSADYSFTFTVEML